MGTYLAYARVSTPRQGERGVSLPEQKSAIERYAALHGLQITRWFEERETASQTGRPVFNQMLRLLRLGKIDGVIIHKIDRSMRNYEDWADVNKLVDSGVRVYFATENLDLDTVAGRLSADIQAAVAVHYSRNLREEVKKGLYGRLKQGFYPFRAPIGYLDQGCAKPKILDPVRGQLIRDAFTLYGTTKYSLPDLAKELFRRGLRNHNGSAVTINGLATILRNPFYISLMRIMKTGQTFEGVHEPLVSMSLFQKVQDVLSGKRVDRSSIQISTYSRIVRCASCGYSLIAEQQKGHTYYRCHNRPFKNPPVCTPTSVREEQIDEAVLDVFAKVDLSDDESEFARVVLRKKTEEAQRNRTIALQAMQLQSENIRLRLAKLADALIDGTIDKSIYTEKQQALLQERAGIKEKMAESERGISSVIADIERAVELAKSPSMLYKEGSLAERRELLKFLLSNLLVSGKNVEAMLAPPFKIIAERDKPLNGRPYRGTCRTWEQQLKELEKHHKNNPSDENLKTS